MPTLFAQAALEKAALDGMATGATQGSFDIMEAVQDGRIVLWIAVAVVAFFILRAFRRSPQ